MAFQATTEAFDKAFGKTKEISQIVDNPELIIEHYLKGLTSFLEEQSKYPAAKAMLNWIKKGGSLSRFTCRADMVEPIIEAMRINAVPFVMIQEYSGHKGFFIRSKDQKKQHKIVRAVLKTASDYCRVVNGEQTAEIYKKRPIPDKNIIAVGDLSLEEVVYLEDQINKIYPGEAIGIDKMEDGTYLMTLHGRTAVLGSEKSYGGNFASLLTEATFLFHSESRKDYEEEAMDTYKYRVSKSLGFPDENGTADKPVWVVGRENIFVKRGENVIEVGHAEIVNNEVFLENDYKISFDDQKYFEKLNSALFKISRRKVLYKIEDVYEHYRIRKPYFPDFKSNGEKIFIDEVNAMVANKLRTDHTFIKGNDWTSKLKQYQSEAGKVIASVQQGKIPFGYSREQIINLLDIVGNFGLNINLAEPAVERMLTAEVYNRTKGQINVQSIEQTISKYRDITTQDRNQGRDDRGNDRGRD